MHIWVYKQIYQVFFFYEFIKLSFSQNLGGEENKEAETKQWFQAELKEISLCVWHELHTRPEKGTLSSYKLFFSVIDDVGYQQLCL